MTEQQVSMEALQKEIEELQTKLQFQDDTIQQLDNALIDQGELIDKLTRRLILLEEKVKELAENESAEKVGTNITAAQERPPHY